MRELGTQKRRAFYRRFLDQELSVLVEDRKEKETGRWKGLSRNYIPVVLTHDHGTEGREDWVNHEWAVRVTGLAEKGLTGKILEE